jgi:TetR/AcrR family transcriptional repressor of nem operon
MPGIRPIEFDREAALDAAMDAFWSGGYDGTNLTQLLEATGIARQSLYNTFGDKRTLFLEAVSRYSDDRIAEHGRALANDPPLETLVAFVDGWRHRRRRTKGRGCLACLAAMEMGRKDAEVAAAVARHTTRLTAAFRNPLERAGVDDPAGVAASLVASHYGISLLCRSRGMQPLVDSATNAAVRMLEALKWPSSASSSGSSRSCLA